MQHYRSAPPAVQSKLPLPRNHLSSRGFRSRGTRVRTCTATAREPTGAGVESPRVKLLLRRRLQVRHWLREVGILPRVSGVWRVILACTPAAAGSTGLPTRLGVALRDSGHGDHCVCVSFASMRIVRRGARAGRAEREPWRHRQVARRRWCWGGRGISAPRMALSPSSVPLVQHEPVSVLSRFGRTESDILPNSDCAPSWKLGASFGFFTHAEYPPNTPSSLQPPQNRSVLSAAPMPSAVPEGCRFLRACLNRAYLAISV